MTKRHTIEEAPIIEHDDLRELMEADDPSPCISIYVDTSPQTDEKDGNRIRYKDQVKTAGEALRARGAEKRLTDGLLARLEEVGTTETFWLHQQYGLAVFLSRERLLVRRLMGRPGNHAVVADTFNLRPAHQLLRGAMRHQLLCLSVGRVALYESDGRTVGEVDLHPDVPGDLSGTRGEPARASAPDDVDPSGSDREKLAQFFRDVDRSVLEHHSRPSGLPLMLVALREYQGLFREGSRNPFLLEAGLDRDPFDGSSARELEDLARPHVEEALGTDVDAVLDRFHQALGNDLGARSLPDIAAAATAGQVDTLLVEKDRHVPGFLDRETGELRLLEEDQPDADDALDAVIVQALRTGSELVFLSADSMPSDSGAAAIYRFAS